MQLPVLGFRVNGIFAKVLVVSVTSRSPITPVIVISPMSEPQTTRLWPACTVTGGYTKAGISAVTTAALAADGLIMAIATIRPANRTTVHAPRNHL